MELTGLMHLAIVLAVLAGAATPVTPATAAGETRPISELEVKAFASYYRQQFPGAHPGTPLFSVTREHPKAAWTISATVDAHPQRGLKALCRMNRADFSYAGRWSASGKVRPYAWIEHSGCKNIHQAVEILQQMPDSEVLGLLENRFALLQSARILLAGNTACASQRSYRFAPIQITVGTAGPSTEVLAGLVFKSDHGTLATVWVRRNGAQYSAWNVSCP